MTTTFEALGVSEQLVGALNEKGISEPFPIQALTISDALAGRDVCGKAKTGSGKTLAFGLPLLQLIPSAKPGRPTGICLVPTRELATQVRDELAPLGAAVGRSVAAIYGGDPIEKQVKALERGVDFIVCTPGRAIDLIDRGDLSVVDVTHVVIDEADRMADMGFLPQVEWILRNVEGTHQTLLFSATLDGVVDGLVSRYQHDPVRHEVASRGVTVEEMHHRFLLVHEMDKARVAAAIIRAAKRTIVFSATKHGADRLARKLEEEGVTVAAIHGDLRQQHREKSLARFANGKLSALVATDVAARGLHIDEVDVVIHYDPPGDHKTYLHRSGRTARAGESGVVVTLLLWNQELEVKRLLKRIGVNQPIVEVFSNDQRLRDLIGWDPSLDGAVA
ncbi:MAG: DEAD/DEAH box helicase [Microthrixaceae bacterium]|nr:DEAD/DEAH box helicase [Microthrixaceae bacterium]